MKLRIKSARIKHYVAALLLVGVANVVSHLLWPTIETFISSPFLAAVMIAALYGGFGPGLFATFLSVLIIDYSFMQPYYAFSLSNTDIARTSIFAVVSVLISWLNGSRKKLMDNVRGRDEEREKLLSQIGELNDELRQKVNTTAAELSTANDNLLQTQQRLISSERMAIVGQIAASLAHQIGTPLNAISGHLKLLARNHPRDNDTQRRVGIIGKQLDFIVSTVKNLLEKTHQRHFALQRTNLNTLIREMLLLVTPMLDKHGITVTTNLNKELPSVEADRDSLHQVLLNLINNSVEAMPDGGRIEFITHLAPHAGHVEIIFRDTGMGIDPAFIDHLFEPMWTTKASGSGFGLSIAREIMRAHGGQIEVMTDQPQGAAFRLSFPLSLKAGVVATTERATINAA